MRLRRIFPSRTGPAAPVPRASTESTIVEAARFASFVRAAVAACALLLCRPSLAISLSLLATWSGRGFNVSHSGAQFAAFAGASVCVYSISSPDRERTCSALPVDLARAELRVRWAPDDSALAVSGQDDAYTPGIWIVRLTNAGGAPVRVYTGRGPGPGSGGDELQAFLDAHHMLISPRYGGYAILNLDTGGTSGCSWGETDGPTEWIPASGYAVGTNRFGDALVSRVVEGPSGPTLSCSRIRRAEETRAGFVWHQFEAVLAQNRLLFSKQRYDDGQYWAIGADVVALDAATLETVATYPRGAPATVSPQGDLVAALRPDSPDGVRFVVYSLSDAVPILDVASAIRFTPAPESFRWPALRPKWSPDGRFVFILENDFVTKKAELISVANRTVETVLDDILPVIAVEWLAANRLIVSTVGDEIRMYALDAD
jgi:hypothetical protein